jgi:RNA polymerase sigma-70 factor (ECF subfamily)
MRSDVDFDALVREHHAALYRFALSMTRSEADASDIVQETFLRWAQRGHQLVDLSRVKSWLFTTLYRETTARRRRLVRFPHSPIDEVAHELPEVPASAPSSADGHVVLEALARVDDTYRGAVALFYLEDYSYPEIAEILGIPLGTVKSRISRGIGQLQQLLRDRALRPVLRPTR